MGYDPRLQFLHESDAIEILYRATREDHPGIFNASGDGVVMLSQAIRLVGRFPLPIVVPLITPVADTVRRFGLVDFATDQLRFLLYGRVADNARLKEAFRFTPAYTTKDALLDYARGRRVQRVLSPQRVSQWEQEVYGFLRRKGQERFEQTRT